ncbi:GH39 family glycosyl hydrolase [Tissierella sp.]|uniref:GH39 family glycosyl hydrolase n=1 Tax=Tissierella sp. TaxID=41274 RepID=UPI0028AA16A2|nr:helix-turn-helix domain-containing protein [Tissierella sp.]
MEFSYELVRGNIGVPIKVFIHSVNNLKMHWHREMEILLVLQGSINVGIGANQYLLRENDFLLINCNEVHNTSRTKEDNIVLALQIEIEYFDKYFRGFSKRIFDCKSFIYGEEEQGRFDIIRHHLAKIVWELNKMKEGHQFIIGSEILLLANHIVNNFDSYILEDDKFEAVNKDVFRFNSIIAYIDENLEKGVTLKDIADNENLSIYYLSHYIKDTMGISFQEYLNIKRLDKAIDLLVRTDKTITEIAFESGFPSTKSLNNLIKRVYNCSPTQYREKQKIVSKEKYDLAGDKEKIRSNTYLDVNRTEAFSKLYRYLTTDSLNEKNVYSSTKEVINVDINKEGIIHDFYWKKLTTFGRAAEGLRNEWQNQLREIQSEIGFEHIRFHGIFSDEMMIYNIDDSGNIIYNWSYVDELFDFFKEVNIKPFIELGFMPSEIRKSDETMFWWKANISGPKDIGLWTDLVKEFIKHCINRYGLKEVESWHFEVWNEPDLERVFWIGGKEEYFKLYKETTLAIKSVSNKLKVGGPSITYQVLKEGTWFEDFLIYCNINMIPLDFISFHIYPEDFLVNEKVEKMMAELKEEVEPSKLMEEYQLLKRIYFGKNHTFETIKYAGDKIEEFLSYKPEIHITEWNTSSCCRNPINDTCFVSNFIIKNILDNIGNVDSLGYWTFTDIMEETKAGISHFHGGFGLINKDGLKKASYFAYYLLSKLGNYIIERGEDYIVTKDNNDIQILVYNFAYFDEFFIKGDTSALSDIERYSVYESKELKTVEVNVLGLSGHYKVIRYYLNRDNGSAFDEWVKMGNPENMTKEEINYLKGRARPGMVVEYVEIDEEYSENLYISVHGAEVLIFEKQI